MTSTTTALPAFALQMRTTFASPVDGTTVTTNSLDVQVAATGFQLSCGWAGKAPQPGIGHYHLLLDKSLVNMYCAPNASVSLQNVEPGTHELEVVPALNDHAEVLDNGRVLHFDYEPTAPRPAITDASFNGTPSIKIVSPKPGSMVTGTFDVVVDISNFDASCDLYGKPDVAGYGHWHLNLDTTKGPMMGMGTMLGMSCEKVFPASTTGLRAGTRHMLIAVLVGNGHAPLAPPVADSVEVTVG